jgi:hypothetical protein
MGEHTKSGVGVSHGRGRESTAAAVAALGLVSSWGAGTAYANNATATIP